MNEGYIKLPRTKALPNSCKERRRLSDVEWRNYVFYGILKCLEKMDRSKINQIILDPKVRTEDAISDSIYNWLKNDRKFSSYEFIINREPRTDGDQEGYIDLKFQHSQWGNLDKSFLFEAKNLDGSSSLYTEYVYTKKKKKGIYVENGGVFRFVSGKYADKICFGGMLGYVVKQCNNDIVSELISKIENVYKSAQNGTLIKSIIKNSINNNPNTFSSYHNRGPNFNGLHFELYHIVMDFANSYYVRGKEIKENCQ
jgi:hypothetical protein